MIQENGMDIMLDKLFETMTLKLIEDKYTKKVNHFFDVAKSKTMLIKFLLFKKN